MFESSSYISDRCWYWGWNYTL